MLDDYRFKTELHAHTSPASGCSRVSPFELVEMYKNAGFTSLCITNHFIYGEENTEEKVKHYIDDYNKAVEHGKKLGINIILGAELRFSENINDYLIYGIEEKDLYDINELLGDGIDKFYKEYRNDRNVLFQAHPFRDGMTEVNPDSLDGVEVFNLHPGHNSRVGVAAKHAQKNKMLIIGGSDCHYKNTEAMCSIMTKVPITDSIMLANILKSRDYIIDISGYKVVL